MPRLEAETGEVVAIQETLNLDAGTAADLLVRAKQNVTWMDGFREMGLGKQSLVVAMVPLSFVGAFALLRKVLRRRRTS